MQYNQYDPNRVTANTGEWTDQDLIQYWGDLSSDIKANRDETMEWTDQYKYEPENVGLLSDRLDTVLEGDSKYIQRARTQAKEQAGSRGLLDSSMAAGAAEGAAIDRGLQVAEGDVGVDKFNVGAQIDRDKLRYNAATGFGGSAQDAAEGMSDLGGRFVSSSFLNKQSNTYNLDEAAKEHEYTLENQKYSHDLGLINDEAKYTHGRIIKGMENQATTLASYMNAMGTLLSSDLDPEDKEAQINDLQDRYSQILNAQSDWDSIDWTVSPTPDTDDYLGDTSGNVDDTGNSDPVDNTDNTGGTSDTGGTTGQGDQGNSGSATTPADFNTKPSVNDLSNSDYINDLNTYYPGAVESKDDYLNSLGLKNAILDSEYKAVEAIILNQIMEGKPIQAPIFPMTPYSGMYKDSVGVMSKFSGYVVTDDEIARLSSHPNSGVRAATETAIAEYSKLWHDAVDAGWEPDAFTEQMYARAILDKHVYGVYGIVDYATKWANSGLGI